MQSAGYRMQEVRKEEVKENVYPLPYYTNWNYCPDIISVKLCYIKNRFNQNYYSQEDLECFAGFVVFWYSFTWYFHGCTDKLQAGYSMG